MENRIYTIGNTTVDDCRIVRLKRSSCSSCEYIAIENGVEIPFDVKRVYYLYDIPEGESRGAHAHKELYQLIIALNGSFDVVLDDGCNKRRFTLSSPNEALLVVPGMWRDLENFSSKQTVCLVLASMIFSEEDYIREYEQFLVFKEEQL